MTHYELHVDEPWDFAGPDGSNRLTVEFIGIIPGPKQNDSPTRYILLKLVNPFMYNNELIEFMIVKNRYVGDPIEGILKKGGIVGIDRLRNGVVLVQGKPFDLADTEYIMIGSLKPIHN